LEKPVKIVQTIFENAKKLQRTIVLPEGDDVRTLQAARMAADAKIAKVLVVDVDGKTLGLAKDNKISLDGIEVMEPKEYKDIDTFAQFLYERRKAKGMTQDEAAKLARDPVFFGDLLVGTGKADGCVAGALHATGDIVRAALYCIGAKEGTVSSYFLMLIPNFREGEDYTPLIFSDCAVIPFPTVEQLAAIASASAETYRKLVGGEPRVAMLSYSTKGSAKHENLDKVIQATELVKKRYPNLKVDGEFQLDAAVIPSIGQRKAPKSDIAGQANTLIFPDLNSGNICYKAVERFARALALGPVLQGLNKPANDLSRGCSAEDIYKVIAMTAVSA